VTDVMEDDDFDWSGGKSSSTNTSQYLKPIVTELAGKNCNFYKLPDEKMEVCPYNSSHEVLENRFARHLLKCRAAYEKDCEMNKKSKEIVICLYNRSHHVHKKNMGEHLKICPDKASMDKYEEKMKASYGDDMDKKDVDKVEDMDKKDITKFDMDKKDIAKFDMDKKDIAKFDMDKKNIRKFDMDKKHIAKSAGMNEIPEIDWRDQKSIGKIQDWNKNSPIKPEYRWKIPDPVPGVEVFNDGDEDWTKDSEKVMPYDPAERVKNLPIMMIPQGLTKSERKSYRESERVRLNELEFIKSCEKSNEKYAHRTDEEVETLFNPAGGSDLSEARE